MTSLSSSEYFSLSPSPFSPFCPCSEQPAGLKFELAPPQSPRLYLSLVSTNATRSVCKGTNTKDFFSSPSASRICSGGRSSRRAIIELFQFVEPAAVIQRGFGEFCLSLFSYLCFSSFSSLPRFPVVILVCLGIVYWGLALDRTFWLAFEFFVWKLVFFIRI